ncbi:MAG TPA: hypothetical protein VF521_02145 [Pyrinomonadaceae bacterium]
MSEEERAAFEQTFVVDEDLFEQARVVEDELVEAYVRGMLSPAEREKFERNFLTTARRRARVEFTRGMLGNLAGQNKRLVAARESVGVAAARPSVRHLIASFLKAPAPAFGAALALLALLVGGWFLLRSPQQPEVARRAAPTPTAEAARADANANSTAVENVSTTPNENAPPDNAHEPLNARGGTPDKNRNAQAPRPPAADAAPTLALFAGTLRGGGETPVLHLPRNAPGANLRLHLDSDDYKVYHAEVVAPDGAPVFRSNNLRVKSSVINLYVPAGRLAQGDYLVKLSALNPQHEPESVADYALRVNRK